MNQPFRRIANIFGLEVENGRDFVVKGDGTISPKGCAGLVLGIIDADNSVRAHGTGVKSRQSLVNNARSSVVPNRDEFEQFSCSPSPDFIFFRIIASYLAHLKSASASLTWASEAIMGDHKPNDRRFARAR